jgi:nitroreductase
METIEAILTRRSIRKYTNQPVADDLVRQLLTAAMYAPSARNEQPWHFVVIRDHKILDEVPSFHPHARMLHEASVAILVCGDKEKENYPGYWVVDCSAATENILLAAHGLGLGAVWVGIYPRTERMEGVRKLIGLPERILPLALVSVGYPAEKVAQPQRFDEKRIHFERW